MASPVPAGKRLTKVVGVRLTPSQERAAVKAAKRIGLSLSAFARKLILAASS